MRTIGNILWFIFGGLLGGLAWVLAVHYNCLMLSMQDGRLIV